ncbi:pilus assembly protein [Desulfobulbus elongatus]|uniref:pilus assembly protein n=1 Tax=Desulfobulbus elongatus TaxID=53332 RepID=UPI000AFACE89|nr:hypothetical protein [Desulfobulbus elongatus]
MKAARGLLQTIAVLSLFAMGLIPARSSAEVSAYTNSNFASIPINLTSSDVAPLVMLNASRDHQLSYKAYTDYADLDSNGEPETTYTDTIEYYGYFDTKKCYTYSTGYNRFVPAALATGTNGHYCSGQWSGNFLNWATMTRMDVVRKLLYGGKRSTDESNLTVLERQYLPMDAHAFAKYYNGSDINQLTPFTGIATTPPQASSSSSVSITANADRTFNTSLSAQLGDQIKVFRTDYESTHWMIGGVKSVDSGKITITIPAGGSQGSGSYSKWTLQNLSRTGISFCNLTKGATSGSNQYSQTNTNPPLIRVAEGNFALWSANENHQCYWSGEKSNLQSSFGGFRSNGNKSYLSGLDASAENPSQTDHGLGAGSGKGEYVVRIEVANKDWLGQEKYKKYGSTYKPIGLLQVYGETDQIYFGLMTGSYAKNVSGGVLRKNISSFANEVDSANGAFKDVDGIVHNFDRLRMYGYNYASGTYIENDACNYQQTGFVLSGGSNAQGYPANQGNCSTWGNPMSEIYLESLRYLAGKTASSSYTYGTGTTKDKTLGLTVASWSDPLSQTNYCAPINVLNFNASVSGYDGDQMTGWTDICSSKTAAALTSEVGVGESLDAAGTNWFVGSNGVTDNELCTGKSIGSGFGSFAGLCPEAPTQQGTYLLSGLAYYANTNRIRTDLTVHPSREDSRDLMVSTYGIALATNVPKIEVSVGDKKVTILPAYRLNVNNRVGGGTLVDFKIIEQTETYGKFYVNWEDSEMGGDYDQDMWGTIEYTVSGNQITITTDAVSASTSNPQGFGYVISGTNKDGAHFHSGIYNFYYTDSTGVAGCSNCVVDDAATSVTYTVTGSSAGLLEDPLWYAAKWGGFIDSNNDGKPDKQEEWDETNNSTGASGSDGLPDNYFYASNPLQLENALNRVFLDILKRASSGTAAAVVSNNVSGVGALYQAFYEPVRQDAANNKVSWLGTVQALWLDSYGYMREDNGDAKLGGYNTDPVIELYYDDTANRTKIRRYTSTRDDEYTPHYMQGKVTAYDAATGSVTFTVKEMSGTVHATFNNWTVYNLTTGDSGSSSTDATMLAVADPPTATTVTVAPTSNWLKVGDTIMIAHFEFTTDDLEKANTLWNARKQLSQIATPETQRAFGGTADTGRFVKTWIDTNGNHVVDAGEFVNFDNASIGSANFGFFDVATAAEAKNIVDYIRGKEISGYRNRTIDYDGDGTTEVIRLGDVVNSTPTIVGSPQEGFDLLYRDASYAVFKKQYTKRRQVLYVGSNDGLLHAFNGGFYDSKTKAFLVNGTDHKGIAATQHPLGAEIWAYAPMNLLPHLKWLTKNDYQHVYYVDGKPKVFDAKIFTEDSDHPEGWGTVLVVGMRFGGGAMTVDTKADGLSSDTDPDDNREFRSAYIVMDITNPEVEPKLLAEIQVPDGSFSTPYPAVFAVKDKDSAADANKWFLVFGSGPNDLATAGSTGNAKLFVFDLDEIAMPGSSGSATTLSNCAKEQVGTSGSMYILSCDTGVAQSMVGDPVSVDWNLDYKADGVYFGTAGDDKADSGRLMRLDVKSESNPDNWIAPTTVIDVAQPVLAAPTPAQDPDDQKWIFFGTGRFLVSDDQSSIATQSIYGVKDSGTEVAKTTLLDTSDVAVETNGNLTGVYGVSTFKALNTEMSKETYKGWYLNLPPIQGVAGISPATRVINSSALSGGVLFSTAYQPSSDKCTGEGVSRLYGLYYRTGTAYPDPVILGTILVNGKEVSSPYLELGHGFATTPSLHSGEGTGDTAVTVFTQLSTGTIIRTEAKTVYGVRSRMESWKEN